MTTFKTPSNDNIFIENQEGWNDESDRKMRQILTAHTETSNLEDDDDILSPIKNNEMDNNGNLESLLKLNSMESLEDELFEENLEDD